MKVRPDHNCRQLGRPPEPVLHPLGLPADAGGARQGVVVVAGEQVRLDLRHPAAAAARGRAARQGGRRGQEEPRQEPEQEPHPAPGAAQVGELRAFSVALVIRMQKRILLFINPPFVKWRVHFYGHFNGIQVEVGEEGGL